MPTTPTPDDVLYRLCSPGPDLRTLIAAAHPDDETIGCASLLPQLAHNVMLLHFTDGAPCNGIDAAAHGFPSRADYAAQRRKELMAAVAMAHIAPHQLHAFNCPDQQLSYQLARMARRLADLIGTLLPAVIITHPFEGGHPDHDAAAFIVHAARQLVPVQEAPVLIEMTSYHAGPLGMEANCFIPPNQDANTPLPTCTRELSAEELALKERMLAAFTTQQQTLRQFTRGPERFRLAPCYNFAEPPHEGTLFYEQFPWGMTGERFRTLAQHALCDLHLEANL